MDAAPLVPVVRACEVMVDGASVVEGDVEEGVVGVVEALCEICAAGVVSSASLEVSVLEADIGSDIEKENVVVSVLSSGEDEGVADAEGTLEM